jgi:cation diffusion facilitator CzcD-associated flavoprotein CzcO
LPEHADLLVIGAGPYGVAAAAFAGERGIDTHVVGHPMSFWREQMPADMFLRSGVGWHLDASGTYTFEAFFQDRGLRPEDLDPLPISVFLDYTDWFRDKSALDVDERLVTDLTAADGGFTATMADGTTIRAEKVLAVPGIRHFVNLPPWYADVPADRRAHTSELVSFDDLAGARVAIVGGRQSAYEWAALLCDHGGERVDVIHRHPTPEFAKVSWAFVDGYVERTLAQRGWWRGLTPDEQHGIALEFWQVGRLTLEPWLVPRLRPEVVTSRAGCAVVGVSVDEADLTLTLTDGSELAVDVVVFASGYAADLGRVPYLSAVLDQVAVRDGFPELTEGFETSLPGLFVTGFASTRDFGPFYGFTKGCPSAARIAVEEMLR